MFYFVLFFFFFFQAEDGIRDLYVTGVQTCALPICRRATGGDRRSPRPFRGRAAIPTGRPAAAVRRALGAGRRPPTRERPASPPRTRPRPATRRPSHRRQARSPAGAGRRARTRPLARRAARRPGGGLAHARRGGAPSRSRHGRSDARTSAAGRTRGFPRSPADRPPRLPLALEGPRVALLGEGRFARGPRALVRAARHAPATVAPGDRPHDRPC